jgi:hypothetical protein
MIVVLDFASVYLSDGTLSLTMLCRSACGGGGTGFVCLYLTHLIWTIASNAITRSQISR